MATANGTADPFDAAVGCGRGPAGVRRRPLPPPPPPVPDPLPSPSRGYRGPVTDYYNYDSERNSAELSDSKLRARLDNEIRSFENSNSVAVKRSRRR